MKPNLPGARPAVYEASGWRKLAIVPLALFLRIWSATLRIEVSAEIQSIMTSDSRGFLFLLWHNRLFVAAEVHRRYRRERNQTAALISGSKDGAWLAALFTLLDIIPVRGSQNRRGAAGARETLAILRSGLDGGITVDGSRGPVYEAKEGAALLALKSGAPLMLFSPRYHKAWRLKSWDRFYLPLPFSRVTCRMEFFESVETFCPGGDRRAVTAAITAKLREIGAESDRELGL